MVGEKTRLWNTGTCTLDFRPAQEGGGVHAGHGKPSQLPMAEEVTDLRWKPTTAVFLNQYNSLLCSKIPIPTGSPNATQPSGLLHEAALPCPF